MLTILKYCLTVLFLLVILLIPNTVFADEDFDVDAKVTYEITNDAEVFVTQNITLTNKKDFVYAPTYNITLRLKNIKNISAKAGNDSIPFVVTEGDNSLKTIKLSFPEKVVGVGKKNNFSLSFTTSDYAEKSGTIYTVSIPKTSNIQDFQTYSVSVSTPDNFGDPTIVKPNISYDTNQHTFTFGKSGLLQSGVFMVFGKEQYYSFKLIYNLENKNVFPVKTEIALPPNTSYQKVLIERISPKPESVYKDKDGNYLATYSLASKTGFKVEASVLVQSFHEPVKEELQESQRKYYVRQQKYWDTTAPEIQKIVKDVKTPEQIYDYVVKTLSYNYDKTATKNERLGAKKALEKPYFAVCLEFTDLFITLARANGIPARAVEGYAYTENDPSRPVSLFEDVLHAWPEYYDDDKKTWVMVDPTWADTTGGVDFFHTFDFSHVTFTRNGLSSVYPVPAGGYKTTENSNDVVVSFSEVSEFKNRESGSYTSSFSSFAKGGKVSGEITFLNTGNFENAPKNTYIFMDGQKISNIQFPSAPPYGKSTVSLLLPIKDNSLVKSLTNITHTITIQDENGVILTKETVRVFPFSLPILIGGAAILGVATILIIAIKTRSLPIQRSKR